MICLRWLFLLLALGVAGCAQATPTPTSTRLPPATATETLAPSPTAVGVSTALPSPANVTRAPSATALVESSPPFSPAPPLSSDTPAPATSTRPPAPTTPPTPVPPAIISFTISPTEIRPGESVTLTWSAVAEQVTLWRLDAQGRLSEFFTAPISGTRVFTTSETLRNHIDFALFATSSANTAQAFVSAKITCPDSWFFPDPPASCPASPPHDTLMQAEHFEHGLMLWTQWNDFIYILYADDQFSPRWDARQNAWFPGLPESDPNVVPPPGNYQPVRGFGVAWRDEQATLGFRVRDRLGWATAQEFSVSDAAYQCDSAPKYNTCYITGPGNVVIVLQPERSGWYVWAGPTPAP
ncbi:MAG: hypothetical protein HW418_3226 [Anaerolineales bacterium]|nr:hypothetical protein [Anaerolineales bacterium]